MTTQTGAGDESRGGSLVPGATAEATSALVVVSTFRDGEPMIVSGVAPQSDIDQLIAAFAPANGFNDTHIARETLSYERLTREQAIEEHRR